MTTALLIGVGLGFAFLAGLVLSELNGAVGALGFLFIAAVLAALGVMEHADRARVEAVAEERCTVAGGWWSEQGVVLPDSTVHCLAAPPALPPHRDTREEAP